MHYSYAKSSCRGFSLVELMVALVVGLLVTIGVIQLFVTVKSSFYRVGEIYERQAALDYLHGVISQEIRIANGPVYPAASGGVAADSGNLLITLSESSGLSYDPYCGTDELNAVEYYASGGDVTVGYDCSPSGKTFQVAVAGVTDLHFYGDNASSASTTIGVEASFKPLPGEGEEGYKFYFEATNRKKVVDSF